MWFVEVENILLILRGEKFLAALDELLEEVLEKEASDLHLVVGVSPIIRLHGDLTPLNHPTVTSVDNRGMIFSILTDEQQEKLERKRELDFSYSLADKARFRVNIYYERGNVAAAFRSIPAEIKSIEELGLPSIIATFAQKPRGFVLITGPTGSGKTTTLASLINIINETREVHVITIEDPIEYIHHHKKAVINQREVGSDTKSFANALKYVLRQDPDVILIGEMRDIETISAALTAAETGHLVFATLHTQDAPQTIDRIVDVFPPHQQQQVRIQLSGSLQGIVSQQLLQTRDGRGRIVATEVMVPNPAIRNLIRETKAFQIYNVMQTSRKEGMQTMDQCLAELYRLGKISLDTATNRAINQQDLKQLLGKI
ncbi:MAG: type IV pilus twitching motility protein PilT [Candidatus Subteraquimicrobiales bacterium]|nr:type IV pilus twitching motility protein PilT [Candidatus Subteraquimicrobiales bacterium]